MYTHMDTHAFTHTHTHSYDETKTKNDPQPHSYMKIGAKTFFT